MRVLIFFAKIFFNIIYFFMKLFPTNKNKILFLSRQSDKPSINFRMLINKLNKEKKVVVITRRVEKKFIDFMKKNFLLIFKQMYHLATSEICIVDGHNISVGLLHHKKNLKVIQLWHALVAIKKFGYQTLYTKKEAKFAHTLGVHRNYDYIIVGSSKMIPYFSKSFNYPKEYFYPLGLPEVDYLINKKEINRSKIYQKYPSLKNKKVILYVPTFRNNNDYRFDELVKSVNHDKYHLIIKKHPNIKYDTETSKKYYISDFSSLQLLSIADYVITDYSAISVDASILNIPIFLWIYDYKTYSENPGLNINLYKEFSNYVFEDVKKLFDVLEKNNYDLSVVTTFKNKYAGNLNGTVTENITKFILEGPCNYEK